MVNNHFKNPEYPDADLHQNVIISFMSATKPVHQVSSESVHNLLRYLAHKQTDRQTGVKIKSLSTYVGGGKNPGNLLRTGWGAPFEWIDDESKVYFQL